MCGRSPARDALRRISRKIPAHPCASRRDGVAQTVHPCTAEQSRRSIAATLRALSHRACDARHRQRRRLLHARRPSMDCVGPIGWECALLLCLCSACALLVLCLCSACALACALACAVALLVLLLSFCGRMPPNRGPMRRGECAEGKSEGGRARCAPVRCMYTDVHSANPGAQSRTRRAGCPEGAPPGVCFFAYFLCTSKESKPLARRASGSSALRSKKEQRRWIPAWAGMTSERVRRKASGRSALRCARETALDSRFRGNDGIKLRCACCVALGQKGERSAPVVVIRKPPATASRDR